MCIYCNPDQYIELSEKAEAERMLKTFFSQLHKHYVVLVS